MTNTRWQSLFLSRQNRTTFRYRGSLDQVTALSFDHNPIPSFAGLPDLPNLRRLTVDHTNLSSFEHAPRLPSLEYLSMRGTRLENLQFARVMCAIAFGPQLEIVNGQPFSAADVKLARRLAPTVEPRLRQGWILTSTNPLRMLNIRTRERTMLWPIQPSQPAPAAQLQARVVSKEMIIMDMSGEVVRRQIAKLKAALAKEALERQKHRSTSAREGTHRGISGSLRRWNRDRTRTAESREFGTGAPLEPMLAG
jgi:hypothetical protein